MGKLTGPDIFIFSSVAIAAFAFLIYILGTLAKWYQEHRFLAKAFIFGLIVAAVVYGVSLHK